MIFPPKLEKGGTVLLTAPSSPLTDGQPIAGIAAGIEGLGFRVRVGESCRASTARGYAAAPPELRAQELHAAFASPEIDAIWCVRGGSTAWQLLPLLDSGLIAANPKPFIGFSDVTTLHMVLQCRCGLVSYHGPTANRVLGWDTDSFSWPSLLAALGMEDTLDIANPPGEAVKVLRPGRAQGELVGGNLSLVAHSLGTPDQVDAKGRILYLEDVGEAVYSLERMLDQLRQAGVQGEAAGLVFGAFTSCRNAYREGYGPEELLQELFRDWPVPVVYNLRSAHCTPMVTLPLGAACTLDGETVTVSR